MSNDCGKRLAHAKHLVVSVYSIGDHCVFVLGADVSYMFIYSKYLNQSFPPKFLSPPFEMMVSHINVKKVSELQ